MELKWIDEDRTAVASPAKKRAMASLIAWAIERVDHVRGSRDVEGIHASEDGIVLDLLWRDHCRGCDMGTVRHRATVPWEEFLSLSAEGLQNWVRNEREAAERLERERRERGEAARRAAEAAAAEARDRTEYERLRRKYGAA